VRGASWQLRGHAVSPGEEWNSSSGGFHRESWTNAVQNGLHNVTHDYKMFVSYNYIYIIIH
jgi:hypothetical protein